MAPKFQVDASKSTNVH